MAVATRAYVHLFLAAAAVGVAASPPALACIKEVRLAHMGAGALLALVALLVLPPGQVPVGPRVVGLLVLLV